tara:strand:- start:174 stop:632 length:459 start_codon:yes stop_codon:yes gene_type:complete
VKTRYLLLIFIFLSYCATPQVVVVKDPLDEKKNCYELENSVAETQKFKRDAQWEKDKEGANFARAILFWPAMATTFANAEKAIKAADDRTYHLLKIMRDKNCKNVDLVNSKILKNSTQTIAGQLSIIKEMYKSGDLTEEEFKKAKKKVLNSE